MSNSTNFCYFFSISFLLTQKSKGRSSEPQASATPLERKSSQPQKKAPVEAAPTPPVSGAAAAVSPSPVTSPEAGTDSEAARGKSIKS